MTTRIGNFWRRITDGIALPQLWKHFMADARFSYRLYSQEIDSRRVAGTGRVRHFFKMATLFLWAIIDKLSPARRVLLLIALFLLFSNMQASWHDNNGQLITFQFGGAFWGGMLLLVLLTLEIADRVVMKRDLQIAKEIQAWLLPPGPPQVPGLQIAFATRPANTVAGDYYDVFPRSASNSPGGAYLITIADVAGKSVPAAMLMATYQASLKTLAGIASAINGATNNPGVTASIITTSAGSRLVLSGTSTGAANAITVTEAGGDGGLSSLVYDPTNTDSTLTQTTAAADANFSINGYGATSASNVVTSAISGVTLNLVGASATAAGATTPTATTLTVTPDTTSAQTAIAAFVTALNSTVTSIQTLTAYNPTTETAGALQGNATIEAFQNQLENILDTVNPVNSTGIQSLSDIGITANTSGTYDTSTTTLASALSASLSGVGNLLGGTNGIASQIDALVTQYTQAGGVLATVNDGLQTNLTNYATQQTQLNAMLATYSATLTTQYNAMDTAVAALKETQTYLTAEFNPSSSSSSSSSSSNLSSGTTST